MSVELPYRLTAQGKETIRKVRGALKEAGYESWPWVGAWFGLSKRPRFQWIAFLTFPTYAFRVSSDGSIMFHSIYGGRSEEKLVELAEKIATVTMLKIVVK